MSVRPEVALFFRGRLNGLLLARTWEGMKEGFERVERSFFDSQFFLRLAKRRHVGNLTCRDFPRDFTFLRGLLDYRSNAFFGDRAIHIEDSPRRIICAGGEF